MVAYQPRVIASKSQYQCHPASPRWHELDFGRKTKADTFAKAFAFKNQLPVEAVDTPFMGEPDFEMFNFIPLRTRSTRKFFKKLNDATATGNDQISASILKRLVDELATPFTLVCRRLLLEGCWPDVWKVHLIVPIYKKLSAFNVNNYRGVHLTSVLSKVAERVIGIQLVAFLQHNYLLELS